MSRRALIWFAFALALVCAPLAWADTPSDASVDATAAGSGLEGTGSSGDPLHVVVDPSKDLPNPATQPVAAWSEVKLARKTSWPLAVWMALAMLGKGLAYGRDKLAKVPLVGKFAALLAKGKGAMILAAIGTVGAAGYGVMVDGGTLVSALVAAAIALAGVTHSTTKTTAGQAPQP